MAANSETEINLKTLQRVDSNIIDIIDNASQVAIYVYERKLEKWEGTEIEGTLFLYRRSLYPYHGFIIVNRLNTTNFIESITSDMQFQLQEPYLLYKNHAGDIIGSWFYEQKDLRRISKKIQTIVLKQAATPKRQRCASESETLPPKDDTAGQDIMTLLSEAHKEYIKNVSDSHSTKVATEDFNNLSTYCEKKDLEKSVGSFGEKFKDSTLRSVSQVDFPSSPRRRFLSTGSFDPNRTYEFFNYKKIQNSNMEHNVKVGYNKVAYSLTALKDLNVSSLSRSAREAPTKLSPLFSQREISSPISDVGTLDESFEMPDTKQLFDYRKSQQLLPHESSDKVDWKQKSDCDIHFASVKKALRSHIQDNPKIILKIHEAYVSSLRSLIIKH